MIQFRPFRNSDPPAISQIWSKQPGLRGLFQPMTTTVLETTVLSKPFFDRLGLILAVDDQQEPVGFVHGGFQPNDAGSAMDMSVGATCMLLVAAAPSDRVRIATGLLAECERYLQERGATTVLGGGIQSIAPFYLGLYGGAAVPGVLEEDQMMVQLFRDAGYVESCRRLIFQCPLAGFRPVVDRLQMQIRRQYLVEAVPDSRPVTWWEACTAGVSDFFQFTLRPRTSEQCIGNVLYWDMEPLASSWGVHARGLKRWEITADSNRLDLLTFFLGESLNQMAQDGATVAEVHLSPEETELLQILQKLGFQKIEEAISFCKEC